MPALHCSQQHSDREWAAAGAEVYSSCHKYERYMLRNKGLYQKLLTAGEAARGDPQLLHLAQVRLLVWAF